MLLGTAVYRILDVLGTAVYRILAVLDTAIYRILDVLGTALELLNNVCIWYSCIDIEYVLDTAV